jgi:GT2 family glycosyltransferase
MLQARAHALQEPWIDTLPASADLSDDATHVLKQRAHGRGPFTQEARTAQRLIGMSKENGRTHKPADLAIVIVSTNEAHWLEACLTSVYAQAGTATLDVVVVDNESSDGTRAFVEEHFPAARVVDSANRGFSHANNRALETVTARYALLLNPDTEVLDGTFGDLVAEMDRRPDVGVIGVRQLKSDGSLFETIRRFPNATRALGDALGLERWRGRPAWLGERELDLALYETEQECDWTVGAFLLARREALLSAGLLDERFFLFSDEPDLCLRIKRAGWRVLHVPAMTIVHHVGKAGVRPKLVAQDALTRRIYADKHFASPHRELYLGAVIARHLIRAALPGSGYAARRAAARKSVKALVGRGTPPFGPPPATAIERSKDAPRRLAA